MSVSWSNTLTHLAWISLSPSTISLFSILGRILLLNLMLTVARTSPSLGRQLVQTKGLQLFATALQSAACSAHLTTALLNCLIDVARELISVADLSHLDTYESGAQMHCSFVYPLLRHVYGYLFSNPDLWIRAPLEVQDQLYQFLATEFFSAMIRHGCVNRTSTVLQCVYNLKYYYALVDPVERSGFHLKTPDKRPLSNSIEVLKLRANFLIYLKQLMIRHGPFLDTEMQALLNYLLSVHEDENLHDVLYFLVTLALGNPASIAPTFIRNNGLCVLLRLFNSNDEANRIYALKLLGFYIHQVCLLKRENLVDRYHLFSLVTNMISIVPVISTLLCRSKPTPESLLVKQLFLRHLLSLCLGNGGNRRSLLQLSVWQSYILRLSPCYPTTEYEANVLASVLRLLRCLVFHAIRYERDGWRVWLDTMALVCLWLDGTLLSDFDSLSVHSDKPCTSADVKSHNRPSASPTDVGFDLTEIRTVGIIDDVATSAVPTSAPCLSTESDVMGAAVTSSVERVSLTSNDSTEDKHSLAPLYDPPSSDGLPPTRSPRIFRWSYLHQILLDDLLCSIEDELGFVSMRSVPHHYGDTIISIRSEKHGFVRDQGNVTPLVGQLIGVSLDATEPQVDSSENTAVNMLQDPANCVFLINLVNLLSDCTDVLVCGSGGLLPLLAAATSPSGDIGALDSVNGLSLSDAMSSVLRIAFLVDCCLLHVDLLEIERQRQMPCGTLARRFARLYLTAATRNCLEFRFFHLTPSHDLVLQLKSFSNFRDGVRYVPITSDACTLQSGMEPSDHPSGASPTHQPTKTTADANSPRTPPHTSSLLRIDSVGSDVESELDGMSQRLLCMTKLLCSAAGPSGSRLGFFPSPWRFVNFLSIDQLFWVLDLKQRYSAKVAHLPIQLQRLVYALRSTLLYPVVRVSSFFDFPFRFHCFRSLLSHTPIPHTDYAGHVSGVVPSRHCSSTLMPTQFTCH
ncbi:unnamed protein product [Dicrocoelium dendriticum]|nr:unnamed protein product [Dicrocoelium dendriticum]